MAKIIQLTTFFRPVNGGVEQQVFDLSKQLIKQGHKVEVICSNATRSKKKIKLREETIEGIKVTRCSVLFSFSQFYKIYPELIKLLFQKQFDIVHVHGFRKYEIYPALLAAKFKRKKIVVTTHNPFFTQKSSRGTILQLFVFLHDITLGKFLSRFIDRVICLTEQEIPYLEKFHIKKDRISVIPNALSSESFNEGDPKRFVKEYKINKKEFHDIVFWVGRINKVKGLENLETAIKQLPNVLFIFAGPDDDAVSSIKSLYKTVPNVLFTGPIPHKQLNDAYAACDIFVMPSYHEAFGLVIIEAMAQGKPVITTNVGGPTSIVNEKFGITLSPTDQWGWMLAIEKLTRNKKLRETMGTYARKAANKYQWKNVIDDILLVYNL